MGVIANLAVSLTAKTAGFTTGFRKASRDVTMFSSSVSSAMGRLSSIGPALAGIAGAASMTMLVKNSMDAIDKTNKLATSLGVTSEKLTGYQHAASLAGVSNEELSKGLERAVRLFGNADAFDKIADMIANTSDAGTRAKIAFEAFGKSGQALIPMLIGGSEGLRKARREAELLGISFNGVDGQKVEAANDSFTKLGATVTGVANSFVIAISPMITAANEKLVAFAASGESMGSAISGAFESVVKAGAYAADWLEILKANFHGL